MKRIKRIAVGFLIIVMYSHSFAAVVSDNDGSTFITKTEFDSLKNKFQAQIDSYNSSIDNKIDGAIASYLAGVQIAQEIKLSNTWEKIKNNDSTFSKFMNPISVPFDSTKNTLYGRACSYYQITDSQTYATNRGVKDLAILVGRMSSSSNTGGYTSYVNYGTKNFYYIIEVMNTINDPSSPLGQVVYLASPNRTSSYLSILNFYSNFTWCWPTKYLSSDELKSSVPKEHIVNINNYNAITGIFASCESFSLMGKTINPTTSLSEEWTETITTNNQQKYLVGGKMYPQSLHCILNQNKIYFDGQQVSTNTTDIKAYNVGAGGKFTSGYYNESVAAPWSATAHPYINIDWSTDPDGEGFTWVYKYYFHKVYDINSDQLCYQVASQLINKPVYLYNGLPFTEVSNRGKVRFKAHTTNTNGNQTWLQISNVPFKNQSIYQTDPYGSGYDHILYSAKLNNNVDTNIEFEINNIFDTSNTDVLYYRLTDASNNTSSIMDLIIVGDIILTKES